MIAFRFILLSSAALAGAVACSAAPGERHATIEERLEVDAGTHGLCATGEPLSATCDPCATILCAQDPYCCAVSWDATCVGEVGSICGKSCAPEPHESDAGPSTCAHPLCATGAPLASACEPCATQLCAQDPYCCAIGWDATCVGEVGAICGEACN